MAERKCFRCSKEMSEGFYIEATGTYFCSEECLYPIIPKEEYEAMYENDEAYWTTWEEEGSTGERDKERPELLRVCFKAPGKPIEERQVLYTLRSLQRLVGGYITVGAAKNNILVLCDEEATLKNDCRYNCMGLYGNLLFVGTDGTEFRGLDDRELLYVMASGGEIR